jgi:CMP-N-acetylneuraminic acid synthetase
MAEGLDEDPYTFVRTQKLAKVYESNTFFTVIKSEGRNA